MQSKREGRLTDTDINTVKTDQGKGIRIKLGLKQALSNGDKRVTAFISSFRSSK